MGEHLARSLSRENPLAGLAGAVGGGVLGYKALTHKYDNEPTAHAAEGKKTAGLLGALGGAASAAKGLATSAHAAGGLPQVAKSFGGVAKNFAMKNPLAAAGVAGAGGLLAGKMMSGGQPRQ